MDVDAPFVTREVVEEILSYILEPGEFRHPAEGAEDEFRHPAEGAEDEFRHPAEGAEDEDS